MGEQWTPFGAAIVEDDHDVSVVVRGEVDAGTAPALGKALAEAIQRGKDVALDMAEVEFLDSAGLRELVRARTMLVADGRRLVVTATSTSVARLLELAGLDAALEARPDEISPSP